MAKHSGLQRIRDYVSRDVRSFSRAELESVTSRQTLRTAVNNGELVRVFAGVFIANEHQDSFAARAHAVVRWAGPRAALGGESALFLWGMIDTPPPVIQIIVPHSNGRTTPSWVKMTRITYPIRTAEWQGLAIITPEVALTQAYGYMARHTRDTVLLRAVALRLLYLPDLVDALRTIPRIRARQALRQAADAAARGSESFLEYQGVRFVFNCPELSHLIQQHWMRVGTRRYRCDFYDAATRTAVELDGAAFHSDKDAHERDIRRDSDLASIGVLTVRFGYSDVMQRPDWCRARLIEVLRHRKSTMG
ncbi:DUF559 domain-containing protein [Demequina aurantiaca]|uniref:DUF559 domain-containing protein n=1 Tax=Demequina aurantiaca TaxID=676200 RepID=UPI0007822334|nr:DUF559 domain-containing protein [Demequina aurantiaca]